ncbi:MAG: AAA domain-containing protein [Gammaproteobacteria bacterium]
MSSEHVKKENEAQSIISTWIAQEALSPQTYRQPKDLALGDQSCIADISTVHLPWFTGEKPRFNKELFYQIILGSIPMGKATDQLIKAFGADDEMPERNQERAIIAAIVIDKDGHLLEDNAISVSSFAWALPLALKLKLDNLNDWASVELNLIETLKKILQPCDKDGDPLPIDGDTITKAYNTIVSSFEIPLDLVESPTFAVKIYQYIHSKNPPEPLLLNSFFLRDLSRAAKHIQNDTVPFALGRYLGIHRHEQVSNILDDKTILEQAVSPKMTLAARWPSPGGHPLVILQQAAVNIATAKLTQPEEIIAVNGPPGTGKTTLLRDIVASCILDRAIEMSKFDDPEKAFTSSGEKVNMKENAYFHIYKLDDRLRGHEMLVASSNNKAVENISKELPALKAVGRPLSDLNYFTSISDLLHNQQFKNENRENENHDMEPIKTWGLIAAVLGNATNRYQFTQSFWWDADRGFRIYLKAAKGDPVIEKNKNVETGEVTIRTPNVVVLEKPPSPLQAKANWAKARNKFITLKKEIDSDVNKLEMQREFINITTKELLNKEKVIKHQTQALQNELSLVECEFPILQKNCSNISENCDKHSDNIKNHKTYMPGFFERLFKTQNWKAWSTENKALCHKLDFELQLLQSANHQLAKHNHMVNDINNRIVESDKELCEIQNKYKSALNTHADVRKTLNERLVDDQFFEQRHDTWNKISPWLTDELQKKREDLFIAALELHKAFIDASAQKMLHNLSILMTYFSSGSPKDEKRKALLPDLWSSLFLVVPVLSTTFASVDRMLADLPSNSIGWLLIDEAGQTLPQAAVGGIMRAKRTIVVGDPLQIPPVVSLPERLNAEICKFFNVNQRIWTAPEASAQTLADQSALFQATFRSDQGPRPVGIPLLVHRRCQDPMFNISNRIAYDGQMVHAVGERSKGIIGNILGNSTWFNVVGEAKSKYCPSEGDSVVSMLQQLANSGIDEPDMFIITPFRIIAQEIRQRLKKEVQLFSAFRMDKDKWIENRVGTIHTVQGREADSVILVLGAPMNAQQGARAWAANTPNILNVAVTRAKQNLYVVGSHDAWASTGYARALATALPVVNR